MNVVEYIVSYILNKDIDTIFGYQGANISCLVDAIGRNESINYVQTYHEQAAAFAANAYANVSEKPGVAIASSGPGAMNLLNGIANAYFDSIPCLFITGNINSRLFNSYKGVRQNGFQELDIVSLAKNITKYSKRIDNPKEIHSVMNEAFYNMQTGRKGPVLLDIPHDIQQVSLEENRNVNDGTTENRADFSIKKDYIELFIEKLNASKKPVIILGNGARSTVAKHLIIEFLNKVPMPVVSSLCGKDVLDNSHHCYRGMLGTYGLSSVNNIVNNSDFIIVLGSRLDERQQTVTSKNDFLKNAVVYHVDIDSTELGHVIRDEIQVNTSVERFLTTVLGRLQKTDNYIHWLDVTKDDVEESKSNSEWLLGEAFVKKINSILGEPCDDTIITVDVGKHQMATAQAINVGKDSMLLNSGGLGSMGYSIPAAIGAYYAKKSQRIVCICGDGGLMMNLQELQLIKRENIPIVLIVVNNKKLGMIEDYQRFKFDGRTYGSVEGYQAPDVKKIAKCFGMKYTNGDDSERILIHDNSSCIIEIEV